MKRITAIFATLFCLSVSAFAVGVDFEVKPLFMYKNVNVDYLNIKDTYTDTAAGLGFDATVSFGRFFGLESSISLFKLISAEQTVSGEKTKYENSMSQIGYDAHVAIALMIPISEAFKIKTTFGYGVLNYSRGQYKQDIYTYFDDGKELGYFGSLGVHYLPTKHFGFTAGADYSIFYLKSNNKLKIGYEYDTKIFSYLIRPYVGCVIKIR